MGIIFTEKGNSAILALCEMTENGNSSDLSELLVKMTYQIRPTVPEDDTVDFFGN